MAQADIEELEARLTTLEEILASAAAGELHTVEVIHDDPLAAVELGVNIVLGDLNAQIAETAEANRDLDRKVAERTRELEAKLEEIQAQAELIARQRGELRELATPVLQLWRGVIAMPIIGVVDSLRGTEITERLLEAIQRGNARYAILDITGVEEVDTGTASHLARAVDAARLLGTVCVLTGIRPRVAQTLAELGVDFEGMQTRRNLQAGLQACIAAMAAGDEPGRGEGS